MITFKQVSKKFEKQFAVKNTSFTIEKGEKLAIIGTSGSGKTTTLKMMNRLIEPSSGEIWIDGKNILTEKPEILRRRLGYVIQNIGLFPHYTVAQNIAIVPKMLGWSKKQIEQRTQVLLEMLGLPEQMLKQFPNQLSGGQQQRIGIARALAADPPVLLMDEPFGALDNITRTQIQQEFLNLESQWQKTVVMVTHDIFEAVRLADRICLMDKGEIQQIGSAEELLFKPKNAFVRQFFEAQYFELAMQLTSLGALVPFIKTQESLDNQGVEYFSCTAEQSLLTALRLSSQLSGKHIGLQILNKQGQILHQAMIAEWVQAFYRVREQN